MADNFEDEVKPEESREAQRDEYSVKEDEEIGIKLEEIKLTCWEKEFNVLRTLTRFRVKFWAQMVIVLS